MPPAKPAAELAGPLDEMPLAADSTEGSTYVATMADGAIHTFVLTDGRWALKKKKK